MNLEEEFIMLVGKTKAERLISSMINIEEDKSETFESKIIRLIYSEYENDEISTLCRQEELLGTIVINRWEREYIDSLCEEEIVK